MRYALLTCAVLIVALLLWWRSATAPVPVSEAPAELTTQKSVTTVAETRRSLPTMHRAAPLATSTLDETKARAAALMLEWALAARPHNFDPNITGYQVHTNREGEVITLAI
jgi:hypothetical protein